MEDLLKKTHEKQSLASSPQLSAWVNASAGSGKTKVLIDRILKLLLSGVSPDKILCITFTNAAAAEMQTRLQNILLNWVIWEDEQLEKYLNTLLPNISIMTARKIFNKVLDSPVKIQTIHSFCQSILRRFSSQLGLEKTFKLMDDNQAKDYLEKTLNQTLTKDNNALQNAFETISKYVHQETFLEIIQKVLSDRAFFYYLLRNGVTPVLSGLKNKFVHIVEDIDLTINEFINSVKSEEIKNLISIFKEGSSSDKDRAESFERFLTLVNQDSQKAFEEYRCIFLTTLDEPRKKLFTKKVLEKNPEIEFFVQEEQDRTYSMVEKIKNTHSFQATCALLTLVDSLLHTYDELKSKNNILDYDDLIFKSISLLSNPEIAEWIRFKLDGGIDHILVDEAQDTNFYQWKVISLLSADYLTSDTNKTIFAVGDPKQSIYGFQGADPFIFQSMEKTFNAQNFNEKFQSISLDVSFRSTQCVLDFINKIFSLPILPKFPPHHSFRGKNGGEVKIYPLWTPPEQRESMEFLNPFEKKNFEEKTYATYIAETIAEWIKNKKMLPSQKRFIEPKDIMVLVRKRTEFIHQLTSELRKRSIPVHSADRFALKNHLAIKDCVALIKFIQQPSDDYSLACVLKSPIGEFTEDDLFEVSYNRTTSLWENLCKKSHPITTILNTYLETKFLSPHSLLSKLTQDHGRKFTEYFGEQVRCVFNNLLDIAKNFEQNYGTSLDEFIVWFENNTIEVKNDIAGSLENAVSILTVHGSKGLQSPIVILPDTTQVPTQTTPWILNEEEELFAWSPKKSLEPLWIHDQKKQIKEIQMEEYYRLLYVALTRAEDQLHIFGNSDTNYSEKSWYDKILQALVIDNKDAFQGISFSEDIEAPKQSPILNESTSCFQEAPNWLTAIEKREEEKTSESFSHLEQELGVFMHKLLEILPLYPQTEWGRIATNYAPKDIDIGIHLEKISAIIEKFSDIFYADQIHLHELPLTTLNGKTNRIDKIVIKDKKIKIIDYKLYKSDIQLAAAKKQLKIYKSLLQKIYADHAIETYVLWLDDLSLEKN